MKTLIITKTNSFRPIKTSELIRDLSNTLKFVNRKWRISNVPTTSNKLRFTRSLPRVFPETFRDPFFEGIL